VASEDDVLMASGPGKNMALYEVGAILAHCVLDKKLCYRITAGGPRDALCQSKSRQLLHSCTNKLCSKSTTKRSNGIRALRSTVV